MIAEDHDVSTINTRLATAVVTGEELEVILVLRGRVRRATGTDRWRIRMPRQRGVTFESAAVVAATPVGRRARSPRR